MRNVITTDFIGEKEFEKEFFQKILELLQERWQINYQYYQESFLKRRLKSLMREIGCHSFQEYFHLLKNNKVKKCFNASTLFQVNVSQFFRDYDIFQALRDDLLPEILQKKRFEWGRGPLKVWSAGCASGEEPYSVAMIFDDYSEREKTRFNFSIIGTDIGQETLRLAREGFYHFDRVKGCPIQFFRRYFKFDRSRGRYRVVNRIKEKVDFLKHDLLSLQDVPGKYDMIFCRNVFIYFKDETREKILRKFHGKLKKTGYLILGKPESVPKELLSIFRVAFSWEHIYSPL